MSTPSAVLSTLLVGEKKKGEKRRTTNSPLCSGPTSVFVPLTKKRKKTHYIHTNTGISYDEKYLSFLFILSAD